MLPLLPFDTIKDKINLNFDLKNDVNVPAFTQHAKHIYNAKSTKEIFKQFNFKSEAPQQYIVKTYFDLDVFQNDINKVENTLYTRDAKDKDAKLKAAVQNQLILTKHRIVFVDNIQGFQTTSGVLAKEPYSFALTTTCAPNAMNHDSVDIPVYFSKEQFKQGLPLYREIMELTYQRCIEIQKANNVDVLIIPPLGLGIYLKTLTDVQKELVISINYQALVTACLNVEKGSLQQIICTIPHHDGHNICWSPAQIAFIAYQGRDRIPVEITNTDALETAQLLSEKYKVSVIIPGSFSTVGGAYKILPHDGKLQAKEESDYQSSNAAQVIPIDTNDGSNRYEYYHFTGDLVCKNEALYKTKITSIHNFTNYNPKSSITTKEIEEYLQVNRVQINNDINIQGILDQNSGKFNTGIYFNEKTDAVNFVTILTNNGITGRNGPKYIHSGNCIILTHNDIEKIKKNLINTYQINSHLGNSNSKSSHNNIFSNKKLTKEQMIAELTNINNNFLTMEPENKNLLLFFSSCWSDDQIEIIKRDKAKYYKLLTDFLTRPDIDDEAKVSLLNTVTTQRNIIDCHIDQIHVGETTTRKNLEDMIEKLGISLDKDLNKTQLNFHRKVG